LRIYRCVENVNGEGVGDGIENGDEYETVAATQAIDYSL
jgi:hypothetical protein